MPQRCTVCDHPKRYDIDLALARGQASNRSIASQYGLVYTSVRRHKTDHLPMVLLEAQEALAQKEADRVTREISRCLERANKLLDACDDWLTDPDDPTKYNLEARAEEIGVIYTETVGDDKPIRKKASLAELLARIERQPGLVVERVESKHADPRELMLKTIAQLKPMVELLARLEGRLNGSHTDGGDTHITFQQINILAQKYETVIRQEGD